MKSYLLQILPVLYQFLWSWNLFSLTAINIIFPRWILKLLNFLLDSILITLVNYQIPFWNCLVVSSDRGCILFQCWNPQIMDYACFNPVKFIKILQISFCNKLKKSTVLKCSLGPVHLSNSSSLNLITFWVNPNDTSSTVDADVKLNLSNSIYFYSLQWSEMFTSENKLQLFMH